jgi:hypothetical protein
VAVSNMRILNALLIILLTQVRTVWAAEFEVFSNGSNSVVLITGELLTGDHKKFATKTLSLDYATVVFHSPGGNLVAGIEIGKAIRLKEFQTYVPKGSLCASACAVAWLGGIKRYMSSNGRVGFHAAYRTKNGSPVESGAGNAIAGAYFNSIGLPQRAILYLTSASPIDMQWLSLEDAQRYGIDVSPLELEESKPRPNVRYDSELPKPPYITAPSSTPTPTPGKPGSLETALVETKKWKSCSSKLWEPPGIRSSERCYGKWVWGEYSMFEEYEGGWNGGYFNGYGKFKKTGPSIPKGQIWEGIFVNGCLTQGTYTSPSGNSKAVSFCGDGIKVRVKSYTEILRQ